MVAEIPLMDRLGFLVFPAPLAPTGAGGAAEAFVAAKEERTVRHVALPAHHAPAALRLMEALQLDSVLVQENANAWENGGCGPEILAAAKANGIASNALNALVRGNWQA